MAEQRTTVAIPFGSGLSQRSDERASNPPALEIAIDCQFDELGGLQTRKPFVGPFGNILGGGTITNARRMFQHGDELLLFTNDTLYSWSAGNSAWVAKGTHLAVKMTEKSKFVTTSDQIDCDRAELSGVVVYTWAEPTGVYVAATDKATGAVIQSPTSIVALGIGGLSDRPRIVALSTKFVLFFRGVITDTSLLAINIDPSNVASSIAAGAAAPTNVLDQTVFDSYYDVVRAASTDTAVVVCRRIINTSYSIIKVTAALAVTASTKARTANGVLGVSVDPTGASAQVVRTSGNNVQGDLITISTLADVYTAQAVGTCAGGTVRQMAVAHRSVTNGGAYRCYAFWSDVENTSAGTGTKIKSNWVDTANALGTESTFRFSVGIVSRAFDCNGMVYVWTGFAIASTTPTVWIGTALQNTNFLFRDDGFLAAKTTAGIGGGYCASKCHLPGVAATTGTTYGWCSTERRVIPATVGAYSARAPRDVVFAFDSNEARRTAKIGLSLYIACGEGCLVYDGRGLNELGFHLSPWQVNAADTGVGAMLVGTYAYKLGWRFDNAFGERERSTSSVAGTVVMANLRQSSTTPQCQDNITHKTSVTAPIIAEFWRTAANPTADAPFFLVTDNDPASVANPNRFAVNDPTAELMAVIVDNYGDSTATTKEAHPENGNVLENLPAPAAEIVLATSDRLFLAGVSGDPDRVWYSKQRSDGDLAAFNDSLAFSVPPVGGDITGLAILNGAVVVFRQTAIYAFPGDGYDNLGGGQNYGPARPESLDIGAVSHESIALIDDGLIFKSSRGWYLLDKGFSLHYIGAQVDDYDSDAIHAVTVMPGQQQIRIVTDKRIIVFDTLAKEWAEWTVSVGLDACIWNEKYLYLESDGFVTQATDFSGGASYGMDVETSWIKINDLQGAGAVRQIMALGEFVSACAVRIRIAYDYKYDGSGNALYVDDRYWTATPAVVGGPLEFRIGPSRPRCTAIKIRLTACSTAKDGTAPSGEALKWTQLSLRVGIEEGLNNRLPVGQKV